MAEKMHFNMQFCVTAQNVRITFLFRFANGELGFEIDWIGRTNKTEQKKNVRSPCCAAFTLFGSIVA